MANSLFRLVVGSIGGSLQGAFTKIAKIHSKQNCAFAIVVGDLFGDGSTEAESEELSALLDGSINVPLPTYFSIGNRSLPDRVVEKLEVADEVCVNLFFLGRKGTIKTSEGIRIAYLGGNLLTTDASSHKALDKYSALYTKTDAHGLHGLHSANILITNQFPLGILQGSKRDIPEAIRSIEGERCISDLCAVLKPTYHFSNTPTSSFIREPFEHTPPYESPDQKVITFFESLASFANGSKPNKWVAAFKIDPAAPVPRLANTTPSPFAQLQLADSRKRRALEDQQKAYSRYNGDDYGNEHRNKRRQPQAEARLEDCFFCMTDKGFRAHLVCGIGNDAYLTVPKGPLPLHDTFPQLGFPGHLLIIPQHHMQPEDVAKAREDAEMVTEYEEFKAYRKALCRMLQEKGKGNLGAVSWEANRSRVRHQHWQFCPISAQHVHKGLVEAAFKLDRENNEYPPFQICEPDRLLDRKSDYFRVWIWSPPDFASNPIAAADEVGNGGTPGGTEMSMFFPLPSNQRFDLQFGRKVMAKLLKLEHRSNWRNAEQTEEEEKQDVEIFQEAFGKYDPYPIEGQE